MKLKGITLIQIFAYSCLALSACNQKGGITKTPSDSIPQKESITANVAATINTSKIQELTNIAKFIEGSAPDSSSKLNKYTQTQEWKAYSTEAKHAWTKFDDMSAKVISWKTAEIPATNNNIGTVFYPFGGPDYLFANVFFPNAKNYVLIGLENAGTVPQIDATNKDSLKYILNMYKQSIDDVVKLSFFRTLDMKTQLSKKALDGTTPIIMLFLAHAGKEIIEVKPMNLNDEGILTLATDKKHEAVQIDFRNPGDSIVRHIIYLSTNLADPSLSKNTPFLKFFEKMDTKNTVSFVKSATYLMHKSYFSIIRNTVLNKSEMILQDDSGIAYKFFDKSKWDITLYGSYIKPIPLFKDFFEEDLLEAYKKKSKPLDFRYGYSAKSGLLLANKK